MFLSTGNMHTMHHLYISKYIIHKTCQLFYILTYAFLSVLRNYIHNLYLETMAPSPRKKAKKFFDVSKDSENNNSMYGFLCKRGFALLFAEAGKSVTSSAWSHPGNRKKAWATAFESGE